MKKVVIVLSVLLAIALVGSTVLGVFTMKTVNESKSKAKIIKLKDD